MLENFSWQQTVSIRNASIELIAPEKKNHLRDNMKWRKGIEFLEIVFFYCYSFITRNDPGDCQAYVIFISNHMWCCVNKMYQYFQMHLKRSIENKMKQWLTHTHTPNQK